MIDTYIKNGKTYTKLENLKNWEDNPREIQTSKFNDLVESIKEDGQLMPLLIDVRENREGTILGGNMTFRALNKLGISEAWVELKTPKSDAHAFSLAIKHNASYGDWIEQMLAEQAQRYPELDLKKLDVVIGKHTDLQEVLDQFAPTEIEEDEAPEVSQEEPVSQLGEVYQLGRHRLMCGDSTKIEDVEKLMNGQKADMVFTDPPYGIDLDTDWTDANKQDYKGFKKVGDAYAKVIGDDKEYNPSHIFELFNYVNEVFLWGANYYADKLPHRNTWFVWDKRENEGGGNLTRFGSEFEICWSKEKHRQEIIRKMWAGLFGTESQDIRTRVHPTQKPIQLCSWFIGKFSQPEEKVIDLFGGSGSTLIACEQLDRTCYMMELDPKYCDVIRKRYAKFIGEEEWQKVTPKISI